MQQDGFLPFLVTGGGVAGMQAALDLANAGMRVVLAERDACLGGQVMRLDKLYPTDHCAFCPTWTQARACREHPRITVLTGTSVLAVTHERDGSRHAVLRREAGPLDADACIFCGLCMGVCPHKAISGRPPDRSWDPAAPPAAHLDLSRCDRCGACARICPVAAIDFTREAREERLAIQDCVAAGGFYEPRPAPAPEFGAHSHPDILTAMAFETWSAECNTLPGDAAAPRCPSDGRPVRRLAFIQCAGARDRRALPSCAAVCCLHAAKQAAWLKRRCPEMDITIFYTDMRAPGKAQEAYVQRARDAGIRFVRRRPGLVTPLLPPEQGIAIRHEQGMDLVTSRVDMLVLNGGLAACPRPEGGQGESCGFGREPADVAQSVIQAGHAAARLCAGQRAGASGSRQDGEAIR